MALPAQPDVFMGVALQQAQPQPAPFEAKTLSSFSVFNQQEIVDSLRELHKELKLNLEIANPLELTIDARGNLLQQGRDLPPATEKQLVAIAKLVNIDILPLSQSSSLAVPSQYNPKLLMDFQNQLNQFLKNSKWVKFELNNGPISRLCSRILTKSPKEDKSLERKACKWAFKTGIATLVLAAAFKVFFA